MNTQPSRPSRCVVAAVVTAAAAGMLGLAPRADAGLLIDMRIVAVNNYPETHGQTKDLEVVRFDQVTLDIVAIVTGADTVHDEAFQRVQGVFRSSTGGLLGDMSTSVYAPFNFTGSQNGSSIDVDGDGDLDIGIGPNTPSGDRTVFVANSSALETNSGFPLGGGGSNPAAREWLIGRMTFTVGSGFDETFIDFLPRRNLDGTNNPLFHRWSEDGQLRDATNGSITSSPVHLRSFGWSPPFPEPPVAAVALTGLSCLALLSRRRPRGADMLPITPLT